MKTAPRSMLVLVLAGAALGAGSPRPAPLSLSQLRQAIREVSAGKEPDPRLPIDLSAYDFHWDLDPGGGLHVVVVGCDHHGYILTFNAAGSLAVAEKTHQIVSLQVCKLENQGIPELITDEVDLWGTGFVQRQFHLYKLSPTETKQIWTAVSFAFVPHDMPPVPPYTGYTRAYVRCDSSGFSEPPRLVYYLDKVDDKPRHHTSAFRLVGSKLVKYTGPSEP
jgi:hypothetical protein